MSNFLAIATVTATLQSLLTRAATDAVSGALVKTGRPEGNDQGAAAWTGINLFLYSVSPNPSFRNADARTRPTGASPIAVDLDYLLTFYGKDDELEPQRLLGAAVNSLNTTPVLTRAMIQDTIDIATRSDPAHFLGDSDLAQQSEIVQMTPVPLDLEELSRLWSVFSPTPYALSMAYRASVVLIDSQGSGD